MLTDESDQPCHAFTCDGCREPQAPFAYRMWAEVLETRHVLTYRFDISDWWCENCQTVTDWCQQISPH